MAIDLMKLFAGRSLAIDRHALEGLAQRAAVRLAGVADIAEARSRYQAAAGSGRRGFATTPTNDVAVVHLTGFIDPDPFMSWIFGGTSPDALVGTLREAASAVAAIVLVVDSPGGSVDLIPETAAAIRAIGSRTPITAIARSLMASAACWLGSACNEIVASPSSQLGSIGVMSVHLDESGLNARIGIKPTYIYTPEYKTELNSDFPLSPEALAYQQQEIEDLYQTFVSDVSIGRGVRTSKVKNDFGKGRLMNAAAAVRVGLADRIDTLETVVSQAAARRSRTLERSGAQQAIRDLELLDLSLSIRGRM